MPQVLDNVIDDVIAFLRGRDGIVASQVSEGPLDHTLVGSLPMWFVQMFSDEPGDRYSGGATRTATLAISLVVPISDALLNDPDDPQSERQQLNVIAEPFYAELEAYAENTATPDRSWAKLLENEEGRRYVGFGDKDRRVGVIALWDATYERPLGATA